MRILTFNVGSSSTKAAVLQRASDGTLHRVHGLTDANATFTAMMEEFEAFGPFDAVAHRIVHGGRFAFEGARIADDEVRAEIAAVSHLAPDHNPAALRIIEACLRRYEARTVQVAVFDSAFHRTMPAQAFTYPIPLDLARRFGIRRYGFHGLSHEYSARQVLALDGRRTLAHVSAHVGNGVSVAAILDGESQDTTMGFTPLEGAMMGTRSGTLDPGIIFELQRNGISPERLSLIIDGESGLLGLSGYSSDYHFVAEEAKKGNTHCLLALDVYARRLAGEIARMAAALGGLDVLTFTGGVGEHSADLRSAVCAQLSFAGIELDISKNAAVRTGHDLEIGTPASTGRIFTIACREEDSIARHALEEIYARTALS